MSVAIYARISRDRDGDGLGILRQLVDCRKETERRRWTVAAEYVDDDISAYSGKQRPAYRRMLEDIRDGTRDAVIVWHLHSCWCCQCRDSAWRLQPGIRRRPPGRTPAFCRRRQRKRLQAEATAAEIPRDRRSRHATHGGGSRAFGYGPDKITPVPEPNCMTGGGPVYCTAASPGPRLRPGRARPATAPSR